MPGETSSITAQVTSLVPKGASGINVPRELKDPLGHPFAGNQQAVRGEAFAANETKTYSFRWTSPPDAPTGVYTASIGVFDASWSRLYVWKANDQAFTVGPEGPPTFAVAAMTVGPPSVGAGQALSLKTTVTNTSAEPAANVIGDVAWTTMYLYDWHASSFRMTR